MSDKARKIIPSSVLFAEWRKDPEYVRAYEALEEEYAEERRRIAARKARAVARLKRMKMAKQTAKPATPAKPRQPSEVVASK